MKEFKPETKREAYLLDQLWKALDQLDECYWQYIPVATRRSDATDTFISKLRAKFPLLDKRLSKKRFKKFTQELNNKS